MLQLAVVDKCTHMKMTYYNTYPNHDHLSINIIDGHFSAQHMTSTNLPNAIIMKSCTNNDQKTEVVERLGKSHLKVYSLLVMVFT